MLALAQLMQGLEVCRVYQRQIGQVERPEQAPDWRALLQHHVCELRQLLTRHWQDEFL